MLAEIVLSMGHLVLYMSDCSDLQKWGRNQLYMETDNVICKNDSNEILIVQLGSSASQDQLDYIDEKDRYELVAGAVGDFEIIVRVVETSDVDLETKSEKYH
jgi:hypothetical protein